MILFYLSSHELVTIEEISTLLEISKRTVYRDLDMLRTAGVEIESTTGRKGGISLAKSFNIDQLLLDKNEWKTLIFNSLCMGQFKDTKFSNEARELYKKLTKLFHSESDMKQKKVLIDMSYKFQDTDHIKKLRLFENAIDLKQLVYITYESPFCEFLSTSGYVSPYGLVNKVGFWYLVGYCHIHQMYRAFNLAYIISYELTDIDFKREEGFDLEEFWRRSNPR
jgi:predicted DNA-binding transcriptional regulator YafY